MFERFTRAARAVAAQAEEEARAAGSGTVEAEHLLLALTDERIGGEVTRVLAAADLDREGVLDALATQRDQSLAAVGVAPGGLEAPPPRAKSGRLRFGASARLALERSLRAALDHGDRRIEPAHVLLGLLRAEAGTVPRTLRAAGTDSRELADAVKATLAGGSAD